MAHAKAFLGKGESQTKSQRMIVATAGHVDHGKTALVRALTGVDTDRLPEEKARGMTIDLGFAYRTLSGGAMLGFVDVPGHERFVRNMLAGICNVDHALLVVAADDGVMPQTREHLAILSLIGIAAATVAISKVDRVGVERRREVEAEVGALLANTALADPPMFATSIVSGEGIDELRGHLADAAMRQRARPVSGHFRMAVDRAFLLHGVGLVATGTVFAGVLRTNDALAVAPAGLPNRARRLRIHDRDVAEVRAGDRCAVNLTDLQRTNLSRGDWLTAPEAVNATRRIDVRLEMLGSETRPLRHLLAAHLHLGAEDVACRVSLLAGKTVAPGAHAYASLVLERPIAAWSGDRFILRERSPARTIGGGCVLDPAAPERAPRALRLARLAALDTPDPATAARRLLAVSDRGLDLVRFARAWNLTPTEEHALVADRSVVAWAGGGVRMVFAPQHWQALLDATVEALGAHHHAHAHLLGLNDEHLHIALGRRVALPALREAIGQLRERGLVRRTGTIHHLAAHRVTPTSAEIVLWAKIEPVLARGGIRPPRLLELAAEIGLDAVILDAFLGRAEALGWLVRVAKNRAFPPLALQELERIARGLAAQSATGAFAVAEFNEATGIGRNLSVQVLEFFDRLGVTRRDGDQRRVNGG
jgi:selenocysteine-specific elongation factor